ncbi:hypothetical protein [Micromonospora mirobrigensis]|uniref:Uncharacterized protein n=1 Tax=Micromonospora mirobrigensis TaxID=262898 RepID=A0A1C5AQ44_9ACTN|nr:hypothetical protein [Micromonospora mirobrigensis]SCF47191.1 hypothetical protein GA0070564_11716 [Micromonospora mirobrigensis]
MALVCTEITEWVEEEVSRPVEEWEERQEKKCKDYPWYDPRGWVCWFVTYFVKVVRWVLVKVGKWVARTVCKLVGVVVDLVVDVAVGLWDVVAGIFTLDWRRILDGLIGIGLAVLLGAIGLGRIVFLGDTFQYIVEEVNRWRLRDHVRGLLEAKYSGDTLADIKAAIRLDHGAFGLRLHGTAYRTVLDSQAPSPREPGVPNLVGLHEQGAINLRALCGFEFDEGFWNRKRYKTLKKGTVVGGGGGGEFDNPISADELDTYLDSRGARGPTFIVLPMRDGALDTKVATAREKGRELALMLDFDTDRRGVTDPDHIVHHGYDRADTHPKLTSFLTGVIGRHDKRTDPDGAVGDLCHPVVVGVFRYTDTLRGLANNLFDSGCGLTGRDTTGATFVDNVPDRIWKYVPIHELGHTFGLCHTDGVDRVMFSPKQHTAWQKWYLIPRLILTVYLDGEPSFTFDEAKATWDYVVAHFAPQCLGARPVVIG